METRISGKVSKDTHADIVRVQIVLRRHDLAKTLAQTAKYLCNLALADATNKIAYPSEPADSSISIPFTNGKEYEEVTGKYREDRAIAKSNAFVLQVLKHGLALWQAGKRPGIPTDAPIDPTTSPASPGKDGTSTPQGLDEDPAP